MILLDIKAAAELLGVSEKTIARLGQSGELKRYKIRRLVRYEKEDILEYIERSEVSRPKAKATAKRGRFEYIPGMKIV